MTHSPMTPEEIKAELKARNLSMSAVGRRLRPRVSPKAVYVNVEQLPGQSSARVRRAIARAVGRTVEQVFGGEGDEPSAEVASRQEIERVA